MTQSYYFRILDQINVPGWRPHSEDLLGACPTEQPRLLYALDGATSQTPARLFLESPSDPFWLVNQTKSALEASWNEGLTSDQIYKLVQADLNDAFRAESNKPDATPAHMPCTAIRAARLIDTAEGAMIEVASGGNGMALMQDPDGRVETLDTIYRERFDLDRAIKEQVDQGKTRQEIAAAVADLNRRCAMASTSLAVRA